MKSDIPAIIEGGTAMDDRGFLKFFNGLDFSELGIKRFYQVENHNTGIIRAWHGHLKEGKYIYVVKGEALIGAVPIGINGLAHEGMEANKYFLSARQPRLLWIPPGFANGFKTLSIGTTIMFFSTSALEESKDDDFRFPWNKWNIWKVEHR